MARVSLSLSPVAPDTAKRSEPAKSIRFNELSYFSSGNSLCPIKWRVKILKDKIRI